MIKMNDIKTHAASLKTHAQVLERKKLPFKLQIL